MGRAGGGGRSGGGGHSSHSSHSFSSSRSSSSHSFSSSGRAGRSSVSGGSSFGRSSGGYRPPPPPPPRGGHIHVHHTYGPSYGGYRSGPARRQSSGSLVAAIAIFIVVVIVMTAIANMIGSGSIVGGSGNIPKSTVNREKVELGYGFTNNTLTDEIGWISNSGRLNKGLKDFYNATGLVPYIYLKAYDPYIDLSNTQTAATQREAIAGQWYEDHLDHEGYVLLVYFSSGREDYGTDGECTLVMGHQASTVMDGEAQEIFWAYLDKYWFSDVDEDTLFANAFSDTANRIMQRTPTGVDAVINVAKVAVVVGVIGGVIFIMMVKRKHEAERAAETERILNTPLGQDDPFDEDE